MKTHLCHPCLEVLAASLDKKEQENAVLAAEVTLVEDEERRLREENETLRQEMAKMDKLIYGTTKSATRGTSRSSTSKRSGSAPRSRSVKRGSKGDNKGGAR